MTIFQRAPGRSKGPSYLVCLGHLSIFEWLQFCGGWRRQDAAEDDADVTGSFQDASFSVLLLPPSGNSPSQAAQLEGLSTVKQEGLQIRLADASDGVDVSTGTVVLGEISCQTEQSGLMSRTGFKLAACSSA